MGTTFVTTADEVLAGVDLTGRRIVVTGATAGLGLASASAFARAGAAVVLVGRDESRLERARGLVAAEGRESVTTLRADLGDLSEVADAARTLATDGHGIDALILNAGVMASPLERTPQGHERQLAVSLLGHHLLATTVIGHLIAVSGRVVTLSSSAHTLAGFDFEDPDFTTRDYDRWIAYAQAKTATTLYAIELARRFGPEGLVATAVHPGVIETELQRHLAPAEVDGILTVSADRGELRTVDAGAASIVWATVAPDVAAANGSYVANAAVANEQRAPHASAADDASRLWQWADAAVASFR